MGAMYARGEGVPVQYVKAYAWWKLAASEGEENAIKGMDMLRSRMTATQVTAAQKLAAELIAIAGPAGGQLQSKEVPDIGKTRRSAEQEYTEDQEAEQLRQAAEQGLAGAQYTLGVMYDGGIGVPQDSRKAVKWLRLAAEQGDARAQAYLGPMYTRRSGSAAGLQRGLEMVSPGRRAREIPRGKPSWAPCTAKAGEFRGTT